MEKMRVIVPSVADVVEFGESIGIQTNQIKAKKDKWWNILQKIGYFAVKPDSYIALWQEFEGKGVPCMNWFHRNGVFIPADPTPDEWGVRVWCLQVLVVKGWMSPLNIGKWTPKDNPYQWMWNHTISPSHPFYNDGKEQLQVMGIDVKNGVYRPTKNLITVGWMPILAWFEEPVNQVDVDLSDIPF